MHTEKVRKTVMANPLARHKDRAEYFRSKRNASMICDSFCRSLKIGQTSHTRPPRIQYVKPTEKFISQGTPNGSAQQLIAFSRRGTARCARLDNHYNCKNPSATLPRPLFEESIRVIK